MKTISQTLIIALCALSSLSVSAHGMHKSKPLSLKNCRKSASNTLPERMRVTKKQAIKHRSNATTQNTCAKSCPPPT